MTMTGARGCLATARPGSMHLQQTDSRRLNNRGPDIPTASFISLISPSQRVGAPRMGRRARPCVKRLFGIQEPETSSLQIFRKAARQSLMMHLCDVSSCSSLERGRAMEHTGAEGESVGKEGRVTLVQRQTGLQPRDPGKMAELQVGGRLSPLDALEATCYARLSQTAGPALPGDRAGQVRQATA